MLDEIRKLALRSPRDFSVVSDFFEMVRHYEPEQPKLVHQYNKEIREIALKQSTDDEDFYQLYRKTLLFGARTDFDAYMQYLEFDRDPVKRFYLPRRKIIKPIVDKLQQLEDDELDLLTISQPPGTGKTTLGIFFLSWQVGKYPTMPNLASAHSDKLTRSFYDGVLRILIDPEYLWSDVFPGVRLVSRNANDETIDMHNHKRFKSLTCRSIDGSITGPTRCERVLYADDLVSGIEEALSKDRLDSLWGKYTNDLKPRKKLGCKELHIATRWSVHDVVGRLQQQYADDPRAAFFVLPALNSKDESNFNYNYGVGFDTKYFIDMKDSLDDVSWRCIFMNEPIEREGLLFPDDLLLYYNGVLPDVPPDRKLAACDIAWGGGDTLAMPICYLYGSEAYVVDVVFNAGDKDITRPVVVGRLAQHMPHQVRFEANNGGDEYAEKVDELLRADSVKINITHRKSPSTSSKTSRIIQAAPDIRRLHFLDKSCRSQEYSKFMQELTSFSQTGKNKHDDAADSLSMLISLLENAGGTVEVIKRPW